MSIRITGMGAVSAFGEGTAALCDGLMAGRSALGPATALTGIEHPVGQAVGRLQPGVNRARLLAELALDEALANAGWTPGELASAGLVVATTKGAIGLAQHVMDGSASPSVLVDYPLYEVAAGIARRSRMTGPVLTVSTACASGTSALGVAARWLRAGRCERVLVLGVDALTEFIVRGFGTLRALAKERAYPFDERRTGLSPGEGAAAIALERRHDGGLAGLLGAGGSNDANHITGPARDGAGLVRAIGRALDDASVDAASVRAVSAHGTATRFNDAMEARAFEQVFGAGEVPVHSLKGALGHTMGAAGVLEAIVAVDGLRRGLWAPTAGLETLDPGLSVDAVLGEPRPVASGPVVSTSSGFSGINAAVVIGP